MNKNNNKIELLRSVPVPKALLSMGIPTMIGMMISAIYNIVDAYFVGGLGTSQMGAISVTYPLSQIIVGLGLLFGNGSASYISRLLGLGEKETANKVASTTLYSSLGIGVIFIAITILFLNPILKLFGATDSIMPYANIYASIFIVSSIFNIFNVTMNNILTSEGAAKTTMLALISGAIINIILDPIFINVFNLGVAGAAIASAISQVITTIIYLSYIFKKKSIFSFKINECCFSKKIMKEILKVGIPTLIFQLLTSLSITLINKQSNELISSNSKEYVDSIIAGMGAVTRIISIGSLMVFGFVKGLQPIAGYSYGAKNFNRLHNSIKTSILWSTSFCIIFGLCVCIFSSNIVSLFTNNDLTMINTSSNSLRVNGITFMLFGFYTVYSSLFLALGKGKEGFFLGACRQGFCFIPVILILPKFFGLNGILYAQSIADIFAFIISIFMAISLSKELNKINLH